MSEASPIIGPPPATVAPVTYTFNFPVQSTNTGNVVTLPVVPEPIIAAGQMQYPVTQMFHDEQHKLLMSNGGKASVEPITAAAAPPAEVTDEQGNALPRRWHAIFAPTNTLSGDMKGRQRMLKSNAIGSRPLPLPLMFLNQTGDGHDGAQLAGTIETVEQMADFNAIYATGTYDLESDAGKEAARTCRDQICRFVSVDLTEFDAEFVTPIGSDDESDGYYLISANIGGATQCTIPAFPQAVIAPEGVELDMSNLTPAGGSLGMVASGILDIPPAEWFDDPQLDRLTPITVTDDGHVFGHLAAWDIPHIGFPDQAVYAPPSPSGYAYYNTAKLTALGAEENPVVVHTGRLTLGTGHAGRNLRATPAVEHYDHTGTAVADIHVGEDEFGPWMAGAVRPGIKETHLRALRASGVSGDWREIKGNLELVAVLAVNVSGFPIPLSLAASGEEVETLPYARPGFYCEADGDPPISLVASAVPPEGLAVVTRHELDQAVAGVRKEMAFVLADHVRQMLKEIVGH